MNRRILIADDEKEIVELVELYLQKDAFEVIKAGDGKDAWDKICETGIDLAVIDIMMPGIDGYQLLKMIRTKYNIPVIILSARNDDNDKILGLGLGADDYITKPFNPMEVLARIHAQLRRFYNFNLRSSPDVNAAAGNEITIGDLVLNEESCTLYKKGTIVQLTHTEFKMISLLMGSPDRVFTKKQIFEKVWDEPYYADDNIIMVHMSNLREKIEEDAKNPAYLKTIRGLGYKFERAACG